LASHNPCDTHPRLVHIYSDAGGVPISFPLGNDGVALVTSIRLSLRFQMSEDFIFIDEEVYDAQSVTEIPNNSCLILGDIEYTA
jgi:hypothetical protein